MGRRLKMAAAHFLRPLSDAILYSGAIDSDGKFSSSKRAVGLCAILYRLSIGPRILLSDNRSKIARTSRRHFLPLPRRETDSKVRMARRDAFSATTRSFTLGVSG